MSKTAKKPAKRGKAARGPKKAVEKATRQLVEAAAVEAGATPAEVTQAGADALAELAAETGEHAAPVPADEPAPEMTPAETRAHALRLAGDLLAAVRDVPGATVQQHAPAFSSHGLDEAGFRTGVVEPLVAQGLLTCQEDRLYAQAA